MTSYRKSQITLVQSVGPCQSLVDFQRVNTRHFGESLGNVLSVDVHRVERREAIGILGRLVRRLHEQFLETRDRLILWEDRCCRTHGCTRRSTGDNRSTWECTCKMSRKRESPQCAGTFFCLTEVSASGNCCIMRKGDRKSPSPANKMAAHGALVSVWVSHRGFFFFFSFTLLHN